MTDTARISFSVVICAYTFERQTELYDAVGSVLRQLGSQDELVVVIDYNDELLSTVRAQFSGVPEVAVVPNTDTKGLSGARNSGVSAATREIVAFLDDDAEASPDWIESLARHYSDPHVQGVGGSAVASWFNRRPDWFPPEFDWVVGCSYVGQPRSVAPVRNFIGANMSFRRAAFDVAGDFDSAVGRVGKRPTGCEETEFCIRARRMIPGTVLLLEPRATVQHKVSAERESLRYFVNRCYGEGISKAVVSRLAGHEEGLASERTYVSSTLPRGFLRGLAQGLRGDRYGPARAAMILVGLATTTLGFLRGRLAQAKGR